MDRHALCGWASGLGSIGAVWDGDRLDQKKILAEEIDWRVTPMAQPVSVMLFRSTAPDTPEAMPGIIETLFQAGYEFVPIIIQNEYRVDYATDHTGGQCRVEK